jgi:hypothetical protein
MTSRFERRLARIEKLQPPAPEPPADPRIGVLMTFIGFYYCDRREDERPLAAFVAAANGSNAEAEAMMQGLLDDLSASHGISIDSEPTPDAVDAMQRLLDGVPERWRGAAWWPTSAIDMWTKPEPRRVPTIACLQPQRHRLRSRHLANPRREFHVKPAD